MKEIQEGPIVLKFFVVYKYLLLAKHHLFPSLRKLNYQGGHDPLWPTRSSATTGEGCEEVVAAPTRVEWIWRLQPCHQNSREQRWRPSWREGHREVTLLPARSTCSEVAAGEILLLPSLRSSFDFVVVTSSSLCIGQRGVVGLDDVDVPRSE